MYCRNCGNKLNENSKFCTNCGSPINNVAQPQQVQKQTPKILKFLPFIIIGVVLLIIAGIASLLLIVGKDIVTSNEYLTIEGAVDDCDYLTINDTEIKIGDDNKFSFDYICKIYLYFI